MRNDLMLGVCPFLESELALFTWWCVIRNITLLNDPFTCAQFYTLPSSLTKEGVKGN